MDFGNFREMSVIDITNRHRTKFFEVNYTIVTFNLDQTVSKRHLVLIEFDKTA